MYKIQTLRAIFYVSSSFEPIPETIIFSYNPRSYPYSSFPLLTHTWTHLSSPFSILRNIIQLPLLLWMPPTKSPSSSPSAWVHRTPAWHGSVTRDRLAGGHPHGPGGDVFSYGALILLVPIAKVTNPWDETPLIVAPSH